MQRRSFYRRLFEIDPSLRAMFKADMSEQRRKLMQMLTAAVKGLNHLDRLVSSKTLAAAMRFGISKT